MPHAAGPSGREIQLVVLGPSEEAAAVAMWRGAGLTRPWNDPHADFRAAQACDEAAILGAMVGDAIVGTIMAGYDGHRGWLYYLAVSAEHRKQGVGRALVRAAEAWLAARGAGKVQLMLRDGNEAGGFYRALGYGRQEVSTWGRWLEGK